jgi:hypothetical protein
MFTIRPITKFKIAYGLALLLIAPPIGLAVFLYKGIRFPFRYTRRVVQFYKLLVKHAETKNKP